MVDEEPFAGLNVPERKVWFAREDKGEKTIWWPLSFLRQEGLPQLMPNTWTLPVDPLTVEAQARKRRELQRQATSALARGKKREHKRLLAELRDLQ